MSRLRPKPPTEVVNLSYWSFAIWWIIILGIHALTSAYTALYAYCYWELNDTYLNNYLESFQIGMPPAYHNTIAVVHAVMAALHAICILLMLGGSIWQRSLAFTPWSSWDSDAKDDTTKSDRTSSMVLQSFTKVYAAISDRRGICGVNSNHFHELLICREIVETALQTVQAYRMSSLLPRTLLNRFYVLLLVTNCWSSVIVFSAVFKGDEARRRFACIVLDCVLDLMACMGVELIVLLSYIGDYVVEIRGFWDFTWHNDEWAARALNEFRMVVVISWSDLASRAIFALGLVMTTTNMKELLQYMPSNRSRQSTRVVPGEVPAKKSLHYKRTTIAPMLPKSFVLLAPQSTLLVKSSDSYRASEMRARKEQLLLRMAHLLFGAWGVVVLGFHIHASVQPTLPQCLMQVRPWGVSRPSCYLVGLDCHTLGISGQMDEIEAKMLEFDSSTAVQLLICHCPSFEMPDTFVMLSGLHGIKVYNSTIASWDASAAITNENHPSMSSLYVARVNTTDGLLPLGLQSPDFPQNLYDIEFCVTNLRELPDDLYTKWHAGANIQFEYSQLEAIPASLTQLAPSMLAVTGNPINELPPEIFEITGLTSLSVSGTDLYELPRNVLNVSPELLVISIMDTDISFFWSWSDALFATLWIAGGSAYCTDLDKIKNGSASNFDVAPSGEYASILMDPSEANWENIANAVYCGPFDRSVYPLVVDDYFLAVSTPPAIATY